MGGSRWWTWTVVSLLVFLALLGRSGGGLGPSSVCGTTREIMVVGTVLALLAAMAFGVIGAAEALRRGARALVLGRTVEGVPVPPVAPVGGVWRRIWPFAFAAVAFVASSNAPDGCVPYRYCAEADRPVAPESSSANEIRFAGVLPEARRQQARGDLDDTVYTTVVDARGPWQMSWTTTSAQVYVDVFTADAVQTRAGHSPVGTAGHIFGVFSGSSGSARIDHTGRFCVRVKINDREYFVSRNQYHGLPRAQRTGPEPTPPPRSWAVTIRFD